VRPRDHERRPLLWANPALILDSPKGSPEVSSANVAARIQNYIRTNASRGRDLERVGPFLATFSPHTANPYLNYAIPDAGAQPTADDANALAVAFERRGRTPRLEFLPGLVPTVEPALAAAGYTVDDRLPLMDCPPDAAVDRPVPEGIELVTPETDDEILAMLTVQNDVYGEPHRPGADDVARHRKGRAAGVLTVLARDARTGQAAGGGICDAIHDGIAELAGFAVAEAFRRRGIAGAITSNLTRAAHAAGAVTVFLTPGGPEAERVYARAGYRRSDEVIFMSR
jgi:GNAT superfamily N-acetyltransferase